MSLELIVNNLNEPLIDFEGEKVAAIQNPQGEITQYWTFRYMMGMMANSVNATEEEFERALTADGICQKLLWAKQNNEDFIAINTEEFELLMSQIKKSGLPSIVVGFFVRCMNNAETKNPKSLRVIASDNN